MFKNRKKLIEFGKYVLIAALTVSALLLGNLTGVFSGLNGDGILPGDDPITESGNLTAAAVPYIMAATPDAHSGRYGATYDSVRVEALYNRFSAALGEALGSSGTPVEVNEAQWRAALTGAGVYFDYLYEQPLSVLAAWLGTEITGGAASHTARRICLAMEGDGLALYYMRPRSGGYYRCDTALSVSAFAARLREYTANGASFVWELTEDEDLDAYALLEEGLLTLPAVSGTNPLRDAAASAQLPGIFGLNASRHYSEQDGTVYVEGDATLRVLNSGMVSYRCPEGGLELGGTVMSAQAVVEAARVLCQKGPGASCAAAELGLSGLRYDQGNNTYSVSFEYIINGVPVRLADGAAVELTITDGRLCEAVMYFRSYAPSGETATPLPQGLALAAVRSAGGGEPLLAYVDTRKEVSLQWLAA